MRQGKSPQSEQKDVDKVHNVNYNVHIENKERGDANEMALEMD